MMLKSSLILLIAGAITVFAKNSNNWDFFVFTQQWTPAVCVDVESEHKCVIPETVKGWTVHGLWPNKDGSPEDPHDCNSSYPFNYTEIKSLGSRLIAQWPNVYSESPPHEFWQHEWDKHGTCGVSLPATRNEYYYFSQGLALNTQIKLLNVFLEKGIMPSNTTGYDVGQTIQMLKEYFGATPRLNCAYDKSTRRQLFLEVELCMSKMFKFIECDTKGKILARAELCRESEQTFLLPFPERHVQRMRKYSDIHLDIL